VEPSSLRLVDYNSAVGNQVFSNDVTCTHVLLGYKHIDLIWAMSNQLGCWLQSCYNCWLLCYGQKCI